MYVTCVKGHKKRIWKIDRGFLLAISCITASLLCVVLLHNQISTSNKVDNGKHVSPFLSRHIRGALPTDLSKSPSIDSQPPQWLQHYCFGQPDTSSSTAGNAPEGFVLEQVHVVLQPGITSSKDDFNCVSVPNSSHQLANHTNQFLKHTSLHKSFRNIPTANSSVHCLKEELHPLAHLQLHELGKLYKKFYIEKWNLESSHVAPKHFRLHSLDKGDSLSSLVSFMHGILPHIHFQNMIIHKADATVRKSNSNNLNLECNFKHNLTDHLSKHFGKLSGDFHGLKNFSSIVLPDICTSLSQNSRNLTTEDTVQNSILQIDKGMKLCSSLKDCQYLADLHTYSWFKLFVKRVKMTSSKFEKVFISAVDRTFLSYLMSSFRYRNVKATHPGSHITIEIYRNQYEKVNPHYLKILYNGIDISHQIPLCTKFPSWSLCKLKYFVDFQKLKYKSLFESSPNIQKKCRFSVL